MAVVQGIREKVHAPLYDAIVVEPGKQLRDAIKNGSTLKLFVDVQDKNKLYTNLQSASLLPHYNTFEARAMRVVISDLEPEYSEDVDAEVTGTPATPVLQTTLKRVMELRRELQESGADDTKVFVDDKTGEEQEQGGTGITEITLTLDDLEKAINDLDDRDSPPREQLRPRDGTGDLIGKFIYNTVTTLYVGEKVMIQAPTWMFPSGAGQYSGTGKFTTHGEPTPLATFRFAEPIYIDRQQNFRVELDVPDANVFADLKKLYGPLYIWVVLDGYMTRDVQ